MIMYGIFYNSHDFGYPGRIMSLVLIVRTYFRCSVHLQESVFRDFVHESDCVICFVRDAASLSKRNFILSSTWIL